MERHRRDLEPEADDGHNDRRGQRRIESLPFQRRRDRSQFNRTCQTIEEAQAKQCKCRRHAAEQKVFQSGLRGPEVSLVEGGEDVEGQAEQFE